MVWGGRSLGNKLHKSLPTNDFYGESWEISDHSSHHSILRDGALSGQTLRQLLHQDAQAIVGDWPEKTFPWLIKYLDCQDWLSVQVHPDEQAVQSLLPGENSKTEAWFVLDVQPGAAIFAGLKPGVDATAFEHAMRHGHVADCLHRYEPQPGDCLYLPAGTVHAVGGGVLIAEVQQTSDATFRLFDWNRVGADGKGRALHMDQGLASIHWDAGPVSPIRAFEYGNYHRPLWQSLLSCRYFDLAYVRQTEAFTLGGTGRMLTVMVLHGTGEMDTPEGLKAIQEGETILLPAAADPTWFLPKPGLGLLVAGLPWQRKAA
jgi:mannose-6-phosphate isomerase